jgi:hypothetical protein
LKNFGNDLAELLECKGLLAFDLGDEDDDFLSRNASTGFDAEDKN